MVMIPQDEFVLALRFLLMLLYNLLSSIFKDLALVGMVILILIACPAKYLCYFYLTRHRRILQTVVTTLLYMTAAVILHLLEHEDHIFPMVRLALLASILISTNLLVAVHAGILACGVHDPKRATIFISNPAYGGRGPGVVRKKRRQRHCFKFDSSLGFPGEG